MTTAAKRKPVPRKGTAPRRAAKRVPTNGSAPTAANHSAPVSVAPPDASAPGTANPWAAAPPEEFVPTTQPTLPSAAPVNPPDTPVHPYGDKRVYVFRPADGSAPIVFPYLTEVRPTYYFLWKLRKLNLDQVQQSFEWMDLAEVPDSIQERVAKLPDDEQAQFFLGWFEPAVQPVETRTGPPGES